LNYVEFSDPLREFFSDTFTEFSVLTFKLIKSDFVNNQRLRPDFQIMDD